MSAVKSTPARRPWHRFQGGDQNSKPESTIKNSIEKTVLPVANSCQKVPDIKTKKPAVTRT
ncbi:TPA: hypothetical protein MIO32_11200 [Klebsiella variicola]|nr:hypothetical protein [Klebsiella variicola]